MQNVIDQTNIVYTHGERIAIAADTWRAKLLAKEQRGVTPKLSKTDRTQLSEYVSQHEASFTRDGVNFSRMNFGPLLRHKLSGGIIEFETLGPYLESYRAYSGIMTRENLIKEDAIGLELAIALRQFLPHARLISLYDDYNASTPGIASGSSGIADFSDTLKVNFRESLVELYKSSGVLTDKSKNDIDYLLISESSKVADAEALVSRLEAKGYIHRKGEEIIFTNTSAENPLYHRISLRNNKGKWLCEALDAATFLKTENLHILHIVALPDYMKTQQDKVWEILRVLGISSYCYHNIFYNTNFSPRDIAQTVTKEFNQWLERAHLPPRPL